MLLAARLEQRDVGRGDHRDVVAQGDVARHALLLTRRNSQRDVAARQREVGRSRACGHEAEILGQHVGGDDRALLDAHLGDQVEDVIDVGVAVDGQELATASSRRQVAGGDLVAQRDVLLGDHHGDVAATAEAAASTAERATEDEDTGAGEQRHQQADDDEEPSAPRPGSCCGSLGCQD